MLKIFSETLRLMKLILFIHAQCIYLAIFEAFYRHHSHTGTIPNQKNAYIFPILCILGIIFPNSLKIFQNVKEKLVSQNPN